MDGALVLWAPYLHHVGHTGFFWMGTDSASHEGSRTIDFHALGHRMVGSPQTDVADAETQSSKGKGSKISSRKEALVTVSHRERHPEKLLWEAN